MFMLLNEINLFFSLREYDHIMAQSPVMTIISILYVGQLGTHLGLVS